MYWEVDNALTCCHVLIKMHRYSPGKETVKVREAPRHYTQS